MVLRHGKTEEQKIVPHSLECVEEMLQEEFDSQGEHFKGIHDRFLRDQVYCESQLLIGWTEQKCIEMDELAKEDHTYHLT